MSVQSQDSIRSQLRKVLHSQAFASAERMRRFLEFAVEHRLRYPDEPLKEIVVGTQLYAPGDGFDPRLNAAVRVDATRLRAKLREYYESEGSGDTLVIDLPKGSYSPTFRTASAPPNAFKATEEASGRRSPSIAVLPFSNLSPETDDYFSDGLTEEIIHVLSSIRDMRVVARTSCFAFKHKNADIREVGRTLNVEFVLEGSVRKSGDSLRVTAQLVKSSDGYQLWSARYDRHVDDVFAVQDDIAREIACMLRVGAMTRPPTSRAIDAINTDAYAWYLRGRHYLNRQTRESLNQAIACFEEAVAHKEDYAAALSGMAAAWLYLGMFAMEPPRTALPKATAAASRALEIEPGEGEALSVVACVKAMYEWDWAAAEMLFHRSLEAQPGRDHSKVLFAAYVLLPMARMDEALTMIDEARQIDPLSLSLSSYKTAVLLMSRRPDEAEAECRRALELNADFWRAMVALGRCYEAQGRYEDAIPCYERARVVSDDVPTAIGALGRAYALAGHNDKAFSILRELEELNKHRYVSPYGRALVYLGLKDDLVFKWLQRSYEERAGWLMYLATDPRFDVLREDSRFRGLLQKLHLPLINYSAGCV